jgi:hypothetical protein
MISIHTLHTFNYFIWHAEGERFKKLTAVKNKKENYRHLSDIWGSHGGEYEYGRWIVYHLMMEALCSPETWVNIYQTTRCNIPEDSHLYRRPFWTDKIFEVWMIGVVLCSSSYLVLSTDSTHEQDMNYTRWQGCICSWQEHYLQALLYTSVALYSACSYSSGLMLSLRVTSL